MPKNEISDILNNLTRSPGVYKFLDDSDNVIYVGKAKNLRNRVRSYFTGKKSDEKTRSLVTNIKDISIRSYKQKGKTLFEDDLMLKYLDSSVKRRRFMVFARKNLRCFICNSKIKKEYISSRRIYYCKVCQR